MKTKKAKHVYLLAAMIFAAFILAGCVAKKSNNSVELCGNGVIDEGENCENCAKDAACAEGKECKDGKCIEILCGNGKKDSGENCENCPVDVKCKNSEKCLNGKCVKDSSKEEEEQLALCNQNESKTTRDLCIKELAEKAKRADFCMLLEMLNKEDCLSRVAIAARDENICTRIETLPARELCIAETAKAKKDVYVCNLIKESTSKNSCIMEVALAKKDSKACELLLSTKESGNYLKDNCYINIGKDLADCLKLEDSTRQGECIEKTNGSSMEKEKCSEFKEEYRDDCYYKQALLKSDYESCSEIAISLTKKENCMKLVAEKTKKAEYCGKITDQNLLDSCLDSVGRATKDSATCSKISDALTRDSCFFKVITAKKDPSLCKMLSSSIVSGKYLKDNCYINIGKDLAGCLELLEKDRQGECIEKMKESSMENEKCSEFKEEYRDDCYYKQALLKSDYESCLSISASNEEKRLECINKTTSNAEEPEFCKYLGSQENIDTCYYNVAKKNADSEICLKIYDAYLKKNCPLDVAVEAQDERICEGIKDATYRDDCYIKVAIAKKDEAVCNKTFHPVSYARCFASLADLEKMPSLCNEIESRQFSSKQDAINDCFMYYIKISSNFSQCENIKDATKRAKAGCEE